LILARNVCRVTFLAIYVRMWLDERHMGGTAAIAVWAAVTALSRCLMGRHYLGDVVAGILTGVGTAAAVSKVTFFCSRLCLHSSGLCL
jgi:membrane-associated phospholipid phosphatase